MRSSRPTSVSLVGTLLAATVLASGCSTSSADQAVIPTGTTAGATAGAPGAPPATGLAAGDPDPSDPALPAATSTPRSATDTTDTTAPEAGPGGSQPADRGVEVLPEVPGSTPNGLPLPATRRPPQVRHVDRAASAQGRLVAGYPTRAVPPVRGSKVTSSGVSPAAGVLQVTLEAHATRRMPAVLRDYRRLLTRQGFVEQPTRADASSSAAAFARGADAVVVTVVESSSGGTDYTVFAVLRTSGT